MERNVELGLLLDWYGGLLTPRQRKLMELHLWEDLSLSEIAEQEEISRQGVHDSLNRAGQQMQAMERELGLVARVLALAEGLEELRRMLGSMDLTQQQEKALTEKTTALQRILEEPHGI